MSDDPANQHMIEHLGDPNTSPAQKTLAMFEAEKMEEQATQAKLQELLLKLVRGLRPSLARLHTVTGEAIPCTRALEFSLRVR